jgi:hypothetical protein
VFLRTEGTHAGPQPELYQSAEELEKGIERVVAGGLPRSRLLIVEFMAEPIRPGLYRKLSCFRVGQISVATTCVFDTQWIAKDGKLGITPPELYDDELRIVRENPYGAALSRAFEIAGIEYGRADFGLIGGEIQIYEINTNPHIKLGREHPSPVRVESYRVFARNFLDALKPIDTPRTCLVPSPGKGTVRWRCSAFGEPKNFATSLNPSVGPSFARRGSRNLSLLKLQEAGLA